MMNLLLVVGVTVVGVSLLRPKPCKPKVTGGADGQTNQLGGAERIILPPPKETGLSNLRDKLGSISVDSAGFESIRHMLHLDACKKEAEHPGRAHVQSAVLS